MTVPTKPVDPFAALRPYMQSEAERKRKRIAMVRARLSEGTPLTEEEKKAVLGLDFMEFPAAITAHAGHLSSRKLRSLETALQLFCVAGDELIALLDEFHDLSGTPEFHHATGKAKHQALEVRIRKELFCFSDLAHSLQDHARRVREAWGCTAEYAQQLGVHFKQDGQHDFVMKLRTALHHLQLFEADWALTWSDAKERSSHYRFTKAELLSDFDDWGPGKTYLQAQPDKIDVRALVTDYLARSTSFYAWFLPWAKENLPAAVAEYQALHREQRRGLSRAGWRTMVSIFMQQKVDPMPYLHRHLMPEDVAHAQTLPPHSAELADFVIERIDAEKVCDDELCALVHKFFGVPAA